MVNRNDMYGMVAALQQYIQIYDKAGMIKAHDVANSPALKAAQQLANSPAMQAARQIANNPAAQNANSLVLGDAAMVKSMQSTLDAVRPAYMVHSLYDSAKLNQMEKSVKVAVNMQNTIRSIQSALPDMSVLNSISQTVAALTPVFDSVRSATEAMTPLWDAGIIHLVNPHAVVECMRKDASLYEYIEGEEYDDEILTGELKEVIDSETPNNVIGYFLDKGKVRVAALKVAFFMATTIAAGKIQYDMQPMYQATSNKLEIQQMQESEISAEQMEFAVFCIENVASNLGLSGEETYQLLTKEPNVLDGYIIPNYEILHTQSKEYIVEDIIDYMKECEVLK